LLFGALDLLGRRREVRDSVKRISRFVEPISQFVKTPGGVADLS